MAASRHSRHTETDVEILPTDIIKERRAALDSRIWQSADSCAKRGID